METRVISTMKQEFNGVVYYLCGQYFQNRGIRLHRVVWEFHNGPIPKGYSVHHIDGDKRNNNIENLELLRQSEHQSLHMRDDDRIKKSKMQMEKIRSLAAKWHSSEEGHKWHVQHVKESIHKGTIYTYTCDFCGKEYFSRRKYSEGSNHFCHQNCKAKYRTRRLRNERNKNQINCICREA